jgi:hypothetical protein
MNKKDREQLRASILSDLTLGKEAHSPTKDLLKRYAPLEGILTPAVEEGFPPGATTRTPADPLQHVEKSLAPGATLARNASSAWHDATVAPNASLAPSAAVELYAEVKGELRVPNTINFGLFPTLDPFAKAVYYQL